MENNNTNKQFSFDSLYKMMFRNPDMIRDFLTVFNEHFANLLDFNTLRHYDGEYVSSLSLDSSLFQSRQNDCVWIVQGKDKTCSDLVIALEFQSDVDKRMPIRILESTSLLLGTIHSERKTSSQYATIPYILPIVLLHHKEHTSNVPLSLSSLLGKPICDEILSPVTPQQQYSLIDEQELINSPSVNKNSLYVQLILLTHSKEARDLERIIEDLLEIFKPEKNEELQRLFVEAIKYCTHVYFSDRPEILNKINTIITLQEAKQVMSECVLLTERARNEGIAEEKERARAEGRAEEKDKWISCCKNRIIERLYQRFGSTPQHVISLLDDKMYILDAIYLMALTDFSRTANTLEDFTTRLENMIKYSK